MTKRMTMSRRSSYSFDWSNATYTEYFVTCVKDIASSQYRFHGSRFVHKAYYYSNQFI